MNSRAIVVSGLPLEASDPYLISNFQAILSQTIQWFLVTVRTIHQKRWKSCFIEFENPEAASRGMDILAGLVVLGRPVLISRNFNTVYLCDVQPLYPTLPPLALRSLSPIRSRMPVISDFEFVRIHIASIPTALTNKEIHSLIDNLLLEHFLNTGSIRIIRKPNYVMAFVSLHNFSEDSIESILNSISYTRVLDKHFNASLQKEPSPTTRDEIQFGIRRLNQLIAERSTVSVDPTLSQLSLVEDESEKRSKRARKVKEEEEDDVQDLPRGAKKTRRDRSTSPSKSTIYRPSARPNDGRSTTCDTTTSGSSSPLLITHYKGQKYARQESPDPFEVVSVNIPLDDSQMESSKFSSKVKARSPSPDPFAIVTPESLSIDYNSSISSTNSLSLEILSRPIEIPTTNSKSFNRTISTQIPTGYLSIYNAELAIAASAPFIDPVIQLQYESFLEAQLGGKKYYFDLFGKVQEFSIRSKRFGDIAKFAVEADQA